MDAILGLMNMLWLGGLAATPLALVVGAVCRVRSMRPATRHMLWLCVLLSFLTPAVGTVIWHPDWFGSRHVLAAAERVLHEDDVAGVPRARVKNPERVEIAANGGLAKPGRPSTDVPEALRADASNEAGGEFAIASDASDKSVEALLRDSDAAARMVELAVQRAEEAKLRAKLSGPFEPVQVDGGLISSVFSKDAFAGDVDGGHEWGRAKGADRDRKELDSFKGWMTDEPAVAPEDEIGGRRVESWTGNEISTAGLLEGKAAEPVVVADRSGQVRTGRSVVTTADQVRPWLSGLLAARDSLAEAPPLPSAVWAGVAMVLIAITAIRSGRMAWWLRRGRPAAESQRALVDEVAAKMGIGRAPRTLIVDEAVSPMIWCGVRPKLILPSGLWRTLDDASRRAVVAHELAHLRRGDHRVCWVEGVIGALYWWHPVVWWARWRMRDAAEASCDAWVMNVMPQSRRAYAAALVTTKSFLSSQEHSAGPCLGIMSGSAKRLARRITMVMTQKTAPRPSMMGACLATIVLAAGMFVTPGMACPPEDGAKAAKALETKAVKAAKGEKGDKGAKGPKEVRAMVGRAVPAQSVGDKDVLFFGEAPALEAMKGGQGSSRDPLGRAVPAEGHGISVGGHGGAAMVAPNGQVTVFGHPGSAAKVHDKQVAPTFQDTYTLEDLKIGRTPRAYVLSSGKLEAFYQFMARNDVPVLVGREGKAIVIWATEEQHPVFKSFVEMVDPNAKPAAVKSGQQSRAAKAEQVAKAANNQDIARRYATEARTAARNAQRAAVQDYERAMRDVEQNRARVEAEAEKMREKAERSRDKAVELQDLSAELASRAQEQADQEVRATLDAARSQLRSRSEQLESQSEQLEGHLESLMERLEQLEERMDELSEQLSSAQEMEFDLDADIDVATVLDEVEIEDMDIAPEAIEVEGVEIDEVEDPASVIEIRPDSAPAAAASAPTLITVPGTSLLVTPRGATTIAPTAPVGTTRGSIAVPGLPMRALNTLTVPGLPASPAAPRAALSPKTVRGTIAPTAPRAPVAPTAPVSPAAPVKATSPVAPVPAAAPAPAALPVPAAAPIPAAPGAPAGGAAAPAAPAPASPAATPAPTSVAGGR